MQVLIHAVLNKLNLNVNLYDMNPEHTDYLLLAEFKDITREKNLITSTLLFIKYARFRSSIIFLPFPHISQS